MGKRFGMVVGVVTLACAAVVGPGRAYGQTASSHSEGDLDARFEEGMRYARAGDFESALRAFSEAYAIRPMPRLLFNLALCEEKTERWLDALKHYKEIVEEATTSEADRADARRHANALEARVGHIEVRAPASTGIALDGGPVVATTPLPEPLAVAPGHHVVSIYLPAGVQSTSVETPPGEAVRLDFTQPAAPAFAKREPASAGSTSEPEARPSRSAKASTARVVTSASLAGVALVAVGAGIVLALRSHDDADHASSLRASQSTNSYCYQTTSSLCGQLQDAVNTQNRDASLSNVFYVVGGVLGVGAVATWFLWPKTNRSFMAGWFRPSFDAHRIAVDAGVRF